MSAPLRVLTAVTGASEALLVTGLRGRPGVEVVRRCADLTELLAAAAVGLGQVAVLSADLRALDTDALDRLRSAGCAVLAVVQTGDLGAEQRLDRLGVASLAADADPADVVNAVVQVHDRLVRPAPGAEEPSGRGCSPGAAGERARGTSGTDTALADPRSALLRPAVTTPVRAAAHRGPVLRDDAGSDLQPDGSGRVVTVWGPPGAPGRSTVAVGLASELAAWGRSTLLVDADTSASSTAQALGLLDEASGLVGACRAADRGALDPTRLAQLAPLVAERWRVLTGLPRASRWPEVRGGALARVLEVARSVAAWTIVDVGASLEQDEELSYDTAAPRRHAATLTALAAADVVVAVGSAGPVGLQRLVRGVQDLAEVVESRPVVVVNRVRASAVGVRPGRRVRDALERYAGIEDPVLLPDDVPALDAAVLAGRSLAEHARSSPVREGLLDLVQAVERAASAMMEAERPAARAH